MAWYLILLNSIWIGALALALARISLAWYQSQQANESLAAWVRKSRQTPFFYRVGGLFTIGLAVSSRVWWEILAGILIGCLFLYFSFQAGSRPPSGQKEG